MKTVTENSAHSFTEGSEPHHGQIIKPELNSISEEKPNFVELVSEYFNGGSGDTVTLYDVAKFMEKLYNEDNTKMESLSSKCSKNPFDNAIPGGSVEGQITALRQTMESEINHRDGIIDDLRKRVSEEKTPDQPGYKYARLEKEPTKEDVIAALNDPRNKSEEKAEWLGGPEPKDIKQLESLLSEYREACKEFVRKVESGEARSKRSYAQMKAILDKDIS